MIHSKRVKEHRKRVHIVLEALLKTGLYLKLQKCVFNVKNI